MCTLPAEFCFLYSASIKGTEYGSLECLLMLYTGLTGLIYVHFFLEKLTLSVHNQIAVPYNMLNIR